MEAGTKHGFNIGQELVVKTDGKGERVDGRVRKAAATHRRG